MRKSVIDIGTNTVLMLIGEPDPDKFTLHPVLDIQRVPRLGKGVDAQRNIPPESIIKAVDILNKYKKISDKYHSGEITATATSFIRDSHNRDEFISTVKEKTGIQIEVLSGDEESRWTFIGGIFDKMSSAGNDRGVTTIDIGGGSTEITTAQIQGIKLNAEKLNSLVLKGKSLDIGSVRIKEKFISHHPPAYEAIAEAEKFIHSHLAAIDFEITGTLLTGVAGTITTLGALILKLTKFEAGRVDNMVITIEDIEQILSRLTPLPLEEIYVMGDYMEGRADIIIPGILILKCFMRKFGFEKITVSTKGLRYGIFLRDTVLKNNH